VLCTPLLWPLAAPLNAAEPPERSAAELMDVLMWNREPVGGAFRLVDHTGKTAQGHGLPGPAAAPVLRLHLLPRRMPD
jgi:hypothetical protein